MAGEFLQQFNPMQLVAGYEYGQKSQRDEEKALEEIRNQQLRNELLGTSVTEFKSPEFTETRRQQNRFAGETAGLGATLTGYERQTAEQEREAILAGLRDRTRTGSLRAEQDLRKQVFLGETQGRQLALDRGALDLKEAKQTKEIDDAREALRGIGLPGVIEQSFRDLPPTATPFDRLTYAFDKATDKQKPLVYQQMMAQTAKDLHSAASVAAIDEIGRRPGSPFRFRAVEEGNTIVTYPITGKDAQGRDVLSRTGRQVFPDIVTFRAAIGTPISGLGGGTRSATAAKPAPGAAGNAAASAVIGTPPAATGAGAPAAVRPQGSGAPPGAVFTEQVSVTETPTPAPASTQAAAPAATSAVAATNAAQVAQTQPAEPPVAALLFDAQQRFPVESENGKILRQALVDVAALEKTGEPIPPEVQTNIRKLVSDMVAEQEARYAARREGSVLSGAQRGLATGMENVSRYFSEIERQQAEDAKNRLSKLFGAEKSTAQGGGAVRSPTIGIRG